MFHWRKLYDGIWGRARVTPAPARGSAVNDGVAEQGIDQCVEQIIDQVFAAAQASVPAVFGASRQDAALQQRFGVVVPWLVRALLGEENAERRGALVGAFIQRLEIGWREAGVGDMGVGQRVRAMAGALHGRIDRYGPLLAHGERDKLLVALTAHGVVGAEQLALALVSAGNGVKDHQAAKKSVAPGRQVG